MRDFEAIYQDADIEQAQLEDAGRDYSRQQRRMRQLRAAGRLAEAAALCTHGSGYPTRSLAAQHCQDPREGQPGYRCSDCGSHLADDPFTTRAARVLVPCELDRG